MQQLRIILLVLTLTLCLRVQGTDKLPAEDGSYEFQFSVDGQQFRHEKKDANGIIKGEFGFITADGVFHVTVYATDEHGDFNILTMKNIKVNESTAIELTRKEALLFSQHESITEATTTGGKHTLGFNPSQPLLTVAAPMNKIGHSFEFPSSQQSTFYRETSTSSLKPIVPVSLTKKGHSFEFPSSQQSTSYQETSTPSFKPIVPVSLTKIGHSFEFPSSQQLTLGQEASNPSFKPIVIQPPAKACSFCSLPPTSIGTQLTGILNSKPLSNTFGFNTRVDKPHNTTVLTSTTFTATSTVTGHFPSNSLSNLQNNKQIKPNISSQGYTDQTFGSNNGANPNYNNQFRYTQEYSKQSIRPKASSNGNDIYSQEKVYSYNGLNSTRQEHFSASSGLPLLNIQKQSLHSIQKKPDQESSTTNLYSDIDIVANQPSRGGKGNIGPGFTADSNYFPPQTSSVGSQLKTTQGYSQQDLLPHVLSGGITSHEISYQSLNVKTKPVIGIKHLEVGTIIPEKQLENVNSELSTATSQAKYNSGSVSSVTNDHFPKVFGTRPAGEFDTNHGIKLPSQISGTDFSSPQYSSGHQSNNVPVQYPSVPSNTAVNVPQVNGLTSNSLNQINVLNKGLGNGVSQLANSEQNYSPYVSGESQAVSQNPSIVRDSSVHPKYYATDSIAKINDFKTTSASGIDLNKKSSVKDQSSSSTSQQIFTQNGNNPESTLSPKYSNPVDTLSLRKGQSNSDKRFSATQVSKTRPMNEKIFDITEPSHPEMIEDLKNILRGSYPDEESSQSHNNVQNVKPMQKLNLESGLPHLFTSTEQNYVEVSGTDKNIEQGYEVAKSTTRAPEGTQNQENNLNPSQVVNNVQYKQNSDHPTNILKEKFTSPTSTIEEHSISLQLLSKQNKDINANEGNFNRKSETLDKNLTMKTVLALNNTPSEMTTPSVISKETTTGQTFSALQASSSQGYDTPQMKIQEYLKVENKNSYIHNDAKIGLISVTDEQNSSKFPKQGTYSEQSQNNGFVSSSTASTLTEDSVRTSTGQIYSGQPGILSQSPNNRQINSQGPIKEGKENSETLNNNRFGSKPASAEENLGPVSSEYPKQGTYSDQPWNNSIVSSNTTPTLAKDTTETISGVVYSGQPGIPSLSYNNPEVMSKEPIKEENKSSLTPDNITLGLKSASEKDYLGPVSTEHPKQGTYSEQPRNNGFVGSNTTPTPTKDYVGTTSGQIYSGQPDISSLSYNNPQKMSQELKKEENKNSEIPNKNTLGLKSGVLGSNTTPIETENSVGTTTEQVYSGQPGNPSQNSNNHQINSHGLIQGGNENSETLNNRFGSKPATQKENLAPVLSEYPKQVTYSQQPRNNGVVSSNTTPTLTKDSAKAIPGVVYSGQPGISIHNANNPHIQSQKTVTEDSKDSETLNNKRLGSKPASKKENLGLVSSEFPKHGTYSEQSQNNGFVSSSTVPALTRDSVGTSTGQIYSGQPGIPSQSPINSQINSQEPIIEGNKNPEPLNSNRFESKPASKEENLRLVSSEYPSQGTYSERPQNERLLGSNTTPTPTKASEGTINGQVYTGQPGIHSQSSNNPQINSQGPIKEGNKNAETLNNNRFGPTPASKEDNLGPVSSEYPSQVTYSERPQNERLLGSNTTPTPTKASAGTINGQAYTSQSGIPSQSSNNPQIGSQTPIKELNKNPEALNNNRFESKPASKEENLGAVSSEYPAQGTYSVQPRNNDVLSSNTTPTVTRDNTHRGSTSSQNGSPIDYSNEFGNKPLHGAFNSQQYNNVNPEQTKQNLQSLSENHNKEQNSNIYNKGNLVTAKSNENALLQGAGIPKKTPRLFSAQMKVVDKNTNIYQRAPGENEGLPSGVSKDYMMRVLYTFNYTVGFHGHHEEGYTNGAKKGYYYVTGRNGVRTRVDYIADETGFHPKITEEVLDIMSDEVPKPETEKDEKYGLKNYEFKWLYYPQESKSQ